MVAGMVNYENLRFHQFSTHHRTHKPPPHLFPSLFSGGCGVGDYAEVSLWGVLLCIILTDGEVVEDEREEWE